MQWARSFVDKYRRPQLCSVRMNANHEQSESCHTDKALRKIVDPTEVADVNELRKRALRSHVRFVNVLAKSLLVAGGLWIAVHAL